MPVGIAATVTAPVVYRPAATAVWDDVDGVTVFAACVVSWDVLEPLTLTVPAVLVDADPRLTEGVTDLEPLTLAVMSPVELFTLMLGFAVMEVAGVEALPDGIAPTVTCESPS